MQQADLRTGVIDAETMRRHWQGHRRLTRRVIEAFPEDALFSYSIGGMRPFGALAAELIAMAAPTVRGVETGEWPQVEREALDSRSALLRQWDEDTRTIDELWPRIPPARFHETMKAFGQWEGRAYELLQYAVDNEIHHRGQGYVYLRALGIEPPPFWERD